MYETWSSPLELMNRHFCLTSDIDAVGAGGHSGSKLCLRFECIPAKRHTDSIFCTCQPVSLSLAADRGEGGGADRPLLTSDLLRVLWSPHRKQELANSSDVTLPDRPLSPPLTAPPTMKVRGIGLVSGQHEDPALSKIKLNK